jgi:hypothetical protein
VSDLTEGMTEKRGHARTCPEALARRCAVPIECEHGHDVCPICDPCTCERSLRVEANPPRHTSLNVPEEPA